jgi:tetratricopeptide (TPR) repeat protein
MNPEAIKAFGSLWPLFLIVFTGFWLWYYRKPIRSFLDKTTNIQLKRGKTEVLLSQHTKELSDPESVQPKGEEAGSELTKHPTSETLTSEKNSSKEWFDRMFEAAAKGDADKLEEAFTKLQQAEGDSSEQARNEVFYLYLRFSIGDTKALELLRERATHLEFADPAYFLLGVCYERAGRFLDGAIAYESSVQHRQGSKQIHSITSAANCLLKGGKQTEAFSRIESELRIRSDPGEMTELYRGLASLYEVVGDHELRGLAIEKALEKSPNDADLHFAAAWSYSRGETKASLLSVLHYKAALAFQPENLLALNNLGVQYQRLELPIRAVTAYRRAAEKDETLAAANLAQLYANAGFHEEAMLLLNEARKQEQVHPNVGYALTTIAGKEKNETDTVETMMSAAREQQGFLSRFADAYFLKAADASFAGTWRSQDGAELVLTQRGEELEGIFEQALETFVVTGSVKNQAAKLNMILKRTYYADEPRGVIYSVFKGDELEVMIVDGRNHSITALSPSKETT